MARPRSANLLSTEHPIGRAKARFFARLGFTLDDWRALEVALRQHGLNDAELASDSRFGQKYVVRSMIQGPSGVAAGLISVWIVLPGEETPRFITAYPA